MSYSMILIEGMINLTVLLLVWGGLSYLLFLVLVHIMKTKFKKENKKNDLKKLKSIEIKVKYYFMYTFAIFVFIIKMSISLFLSTFFGMSSKLMIYKLNQPLGEGYALWASYAMTALIFWLIMNYFVRLNLPKNDALDMNSEVEVEK